MLKLWTNLSFNTENVCVVYNIIVCHLNFSDRYCSSVAGETGDTGEGDLLRVMGDVALLL